MAPPCRHFTAPCVPLLFVLACTAPDIRRHDAGTDPSHAADSSTPDGDDDEPFDAAVEEDAAVDGHADAGQPGDDDAAIDAEPLPDSEVRINSWDPIATTSVECQWQPTLNGFMVGIRTGSDATIGILFDATPELGTYQVVDYNQTLYAATECGMFMGLGDVYDSTGVSGTVDHVMVGDVHVFHVEGVAMKSMQGGLLTVGGDFVCDAFVPQS